MSILHESRTRPLIMGIVNTTPDSFYDGGENYEAQKAVEHGVKLWHEGADILDIGGESTRPKAKIIAPDEEIARVVPVIQGLRNAGVQNISIDTRNAQTMQAAIAVGANIINDVSALRHDRKSVCVVSESGLPVCLMHMQGTPHDMQDNPHYDDVVAEVMAFFEDRIEFCLNHGIKKENIILDVGIGFGKTVQHNLTLMREIGQFKNLGFQVLLGCSRKSFIAAVSNGESAQERLGGSISGALWCAAQGVDILRVHDVAQTIQALLVYDAIQDSSGTEL